MTTYSSKSFHIKDYYSALTHGIGCIASIIAMPILLMIATYYHSSKLLIIGLVIYMCSMILLYGASTTYHTLDLDWHKVLVLKRIDHMSIFVLIAGTYTPICLSVLKDHGGYLLLAIVWSIAILGMVFKLFWVTCPKFLSSIMYTAMGWACLMVLPALLNVLPMIPFMLLLWGGIFYSVGAIIYAIKKPLTKSKSFGNHEIFHIFVMLGSLCHFLFMISIIVL